ncbi:MAG: S41 family peptidase [Massilibacteroides sp.]|nr:S41 family peptidase [Massilibacteroides sp.]
MNKKIIFLMTLFGFLFLLSCSKDDSLENEITESKTNQWIERIMRDHYLWYDELPEKVDYSLSPEDFFNSLLNSKDGKKTEDGTPYFYSSIEKYRLDTKSFDENDTYGFTFAKLQDNDMVYLWVLYVLPHSPASEAGLQRGDWILGIDSNTYNISDDETLESGTAHDLLLGSLSFLEGRFVKGQTIHLPASRAVTNTPFLCDSVYHREGHTIGYMVYNSFRAGVDKNDLEDVTYDDEMIEKMTHFKQEGVQEFILDLRYNGGGRLSSAQKMTTLLAPESALNKVFCIEEYNDKQNPRERKTYLDPDQVNKVNLNLDHLYVLVSDYTASASELVINSLIPYIGRDHITLIGKATEGKTVGMEIFGIGQDYGYLLSPLSFYIFNSEKKADYADGFTPDILFNELYVNYTMYPFGDEREQMLSLAFNKIEGKSSVILSKSNDTGLRAVRCLDGFHKIGWF